MMDSWRFEPATSLASRIGVSIAAVQLVRESEMVDLHLESFVPTRLWGYDLHREHRPWPGGHYFGHADIPRVIKGGVTGAVWSIATNIMLPSWWRPLALRRNLQRLGAILAGHPALALARSAADFDAIRASGNYAAFLAIQGANALQGVEDELDRYPEITRVTLMHLSNSVYGDTSSVLRFGRQNGLSAAGRRMVERLDDARIFVDLAHASRKTFWDAVEVHDRTKPLMVSHTATCSIHAMWRNVDDAQIRAIAETGGVVGILFQQWFLGPRGRETESVVEHLEAVIRAGGEDTAAIGSDYDGAVTPPVELADASVAYYRLVDVMLRRRWTEARIRKVLGTNSIRALRSLRG